MKELNYGDKIGDIKNPGQNNDDDNNNNNNNQNNNNNFNNFDNFQNQNQNNYNDLFGMGMGGESEEEILKRVLELSKTDY